MPRKTTSIPRRPSNVEVVETTPTNIVIEAQHSFSRLDFDIGEAKSDPAAADLLAKPGITLENSLPRGDTPAAR